MADAATPEQRWERPPRGGGMKRLLAWIVILGLAALAGALLSERNANSYALENAEGALVVKKGLFFPVGSRTWIPADPKLAPAYAPLVPPPGAPLPAEQRFAGREELDQGMFDLLARWAKDDVASEKRERLARAVSYVARAELLPGLSVAQRQELDHLRADAGFFEGRDLVGRAADELRQARERLDRASRSSSAHAAEAGEALRELDQSMDALHRAGRALGRVAPAPAADATAPEQAAGSGRAPSAPRTDASAGRSELPPAAATPNLAPVPAPTSAPAQGAASGRAPSAPPADAAAGRSEAPPAR